MEKMLHWRTIKRVNRWIGLTKKIGGNIFLPALLLVGMTLSSRGIFSAPSAGVDSPHPAIVSRVAPIAASVSRISPVCVTAHLDSEAASSADIETQLSLLGDAGAAWVRFDFEWRLLEKRPQIYDFSKFDDIVKKANGMDISIIAILPQWAAPNEDYLRVIKTPQMYAAYAAAVAKHYRENNRVVFQIGNEPDIEIFWNEKPDRTAYISYLKAAATAIKQVNPDARVISAGILSEHAREWVAEMYQQGALADVDDIGLHLYSQPDPPRFTAVEELRELIRQYNGPKGIAITEFGWPTMKKEDHIEGVTYVQQAAYIAEVFHQMREKYPVVNTLCVYNVRDRGTDREDTDQHMGLVDWEYTKKPAYDEVQKAGKKYQH